MTYSNVIECLILKKDCLDVAVIDKKGDLTYKELCAYAASYSKSFKAGEVVGLQCNNCIEFVVSYFAIIMAGGVVLLLNKELTTREVISLSKQCNAQRILCMHGWNDKIEESEIRVECIDRYSFKEDFDLFEEKEYETDQVITLLPTSGTTNRAKIVCLTHGSLINGIKGTISMSERQKRDTELILLSFATRTALEGQLLAGISLGMRIILYDGMLVPRVIHRLVEYQQVNFCSITPSVFRLLFAECEDVTSFASLNSIVVVGEKLSDDLITMFIHKYPDINLLYGYGMTETGPIAFKCKNDCRIKLSSVGKVLEGNHIHVINTFLENGNEIGEIVVQNNSMMKKYYSGGDDVFREGKIVTGDIGYVDIEGYLYITGRKKNIINFNGNKIFPEEVENVISGFEGIKDVLVKGEIDQEGIERVVAYVVTSHKLLDEKIVKQHCRKYLAEYKIPQKIYMEDEISLVGASRKKKRT